LYPKLGKLEKTLKQSRIPIPYEVYVCSMVFFSFIAGLVGLSAGIAIAILVNIQPVAFAFLLPIITGAGMAQITFFILQLMPNINIKNRAAKLVEEIPHFIGYMATLATSGLSLEGIFKAIANEETEEEIVRDAKFITRNIDVMGMDLVTAISDLIKRTPSGPYSELLEGAIITVQSGGNLKEYFIATGKVQLEEKKMALRKSTESLGIMAELYTILLIVFPLLAIIMLSIMAIMSPSLAGFDLMTLMNLMTYVMVPFFGFILLFMMDSMVPKR
jgi:flagellar protein FlaJ